MSLPSGVGHEELERIQAEGSAFAALAALAAEIADVPVAVVTCAFR